MWNKSIESISLFGVFVVILHITLDINSVSETNLFLRSENEYPLGLGVTPFVCSKKKKNYVSRSKVIFSNFNFTH